MEKKEIRIIYLYEFKFGHTVAEATRNINTAFDDDIVNERTTRRWFEKFCSGDTNLDNLPRGHALSVIDDVILKEMVETDPILTVWEIIKNSKIIKQVEKSKKVR